MPKRHDKITKSVNYDYYWDILFCTVPLLAVSCFYYGARPLLMMAAGLLTAYVADCVVTPLHAAGYRAHEPSSEAFAALIVLMMPASAPYYMVVTATIIAVLVKEAFGGEGHYPFHPAAVGAAIAGAAARLRPILMTGFAMIIGLLPLMLANGVGANGNRSLGTGAVGGMLIGMILQVLIVPALFVAFQKIQEKIQPLKWKDTDNAEIDDQIEQYSRN